MNDDQALGTAGILTPGLGEFIAKRGKVLRIAPGVILHG